ncbi:MAG TPA: hypothetical protein PKV15_09000 [Syntrophomonadaceae bacterium]|nr:hypothetical protein [Syntrophomonadaceae bacterium]HRX21706.1 hypothetical protein [Syntrophomonadaceae bacterium]
MTKEKSIDERVRFQVRLIFKNVHAIDFSKMAESAKRSLIDLLSIHVKTIEVKHYGLLMSGKGPIMEILRVCENFYTITNEGGIEIVVHIGKQPTMYIKEGLIHDLMKEKDDFNLPEFDDGVPDEDELDRNIL